MKEFKKYCPVCKKERNIIEIETAYQQEIIKLSCGHEDFGFRITEDEIEVDQVRKKYTDALSDLIIGYETYIDLIIRDEFTRQTKSKILIDWDKKIIFFKVLEQNQEGEWELEYEEEKPLKGLK